MNWVDLVIFLVLIFFVLEGINKSFIGETLDFIAFLLSFFFSLRFYNLAADFYQANFQLTHSLSNVFGFMTIWFLVEAVLFLGVHVFLKPSKALVYIDNTMSKVSFVPSFLRGLVFILILLVLLGTFPIQPKIKVAIQQSKVGSSLLAYAQNLEGPLKQVFGGITEDTLTFLTVKPKSSDSVDLGFKTTDFKPVPDLETQMIALVNKERKERGMKDLVYAEVLREVGRGHSGDMFTRGYFSHYSPDGQNVANRADKRNVEYLVIGENLAYAPELGLAHKGLMNSPGHRANILSPDYNKIGIGIMDGGVYGLMITQVFSN